ncbi:hypothetical protein DPMN_121460 [Dreissena polymorpha]|uniref:Uncharacterized protein n=1 Tax=Dreissena polymorpha TaxID=45954 RepID=A0A9D4GMU9_DREPO|nr:hypothetical protein DPMN_121460 [Dreissena polymorpha]
MYCEVNIELLCYKCHLDNHEQCNVVEIPAMVGVLHVKGELKKEPEHLHALHRRLNQKKHDFEKWMRSLEKSRHTFREEIDSLHKKTSDTLDQLKDNTIKQFDKLLENRKVCVNKDIGHCEEVINKMKGLQDECQDFEEKTNVRTLILYNKLCDQNSQTRELLDELSAKSEVTLEFHPDKEIEKNLSALLGLGDVTEKVKQTTIVTDTKQDVENMRERLLASDQVPDSSIRPYQSEKPKDFDTSNSEYSSGNDSGDDNIPGHVLSSNRENNMQSGIRKNDRMVFTDKGGSKMKRLTQTFELTGHSYYQ